MSGIHVGLLGIAGDAELVLAGTALSSDTCLQVALGVTEHITKEFCEFGCMLSLLKGIALESLCHLRIALAVCLTAHSEIHAYLTALTIEMVEQVLNHLLVGTLLAGSAQLMYCGERLVLALNYLVEL